jgi:hypothetical protein
MNRKYVHFRLCSLAKNNKKLTKQMEKENRKNEYSKLAFFSMNSKESNYNVKLFFSYGNSVCTKYPIHDTLKDSFEREFFWL